MYDVYICFIDETSVRFRAREFDINGGQASLDSASSASVPAPGGQKTDKNPTDRGKQGSKRHLVVDCQGVPLAVKHSVANVHDSKMLAEVVYAIRAVREPRDRPGRPRKRPKKLLADKGYDFAGCRKALRKRGIKARIARRGVDSSERLGWHRWVVERTLS